VYWEWMGAWYEEGRKKAQERAGKDGLLLPWAVPAYLGTLGTG
jgi:hypothetical protein